MRILLLGASGFVGETVFSVLNKEGYEMYGTYHSKKPDFEMPDRFFFYDIDMPETILQILNDVQPDIIISSTRGAFANQLVAHKSVADYLKLHEKGKIIFISTANVFDHDLTRPHTESDQPDAGSEYGAFKGECEHMLTETLGSHAVILRIPFVWDKNCPRVKQILRLAEAGEPLELPDVFMANYTTPAQIASWISYIIAHNLTGIFHIGTKDMMGYADFYREIIKRKKLPAPEIVIEPLEQAEYQAVLPTRTDIPEELQMTVKDVLNSCS